MELVTQETPSDMAHAVHSSGMVHFSDWHGASIGLAGMPVSGGRRGPSIACVSVTA